MTKLVTDLELRRQVRGPRERLKEFLGWHKAEIAKWWPIIQAANVKVDQPR